MAIFGCLFFTRPAKNVLVVIHTKCSPTASFTFESFERSVVYRNLEELSHSAILHAANAVVRGVEINARGERGRNSFRPCVERSDCEKNEISNPGKGRKVD